MRENFEAYILTAKKVDKKTAESSVSVEDKRIVHVLHAGLNVRKLLKVSKITRFTVIGKLSRVPRKALTASGAQNFRYWNGLVR